MNLLFVTELYPFGHGETFIENEIQYLSKGFEKVFIYAANLRKNNDESMRPLPRNVHVYRPKRNPLHPLRLEGICKPIVWREMQRIRPRNYFFRKLNSCLYYIQKVRENTAEIDDFINQYQLNQFKKMIIYSYWLSTIGMTSINLCDALKKRGIDAKLVSRCHGFDLYKERAHLGYLPFQAYMLQRFDRIFPCSAQGTAYLQAEFPEYKEKIETDHLGIPDRFHGKWPVQEPFSIVSCSNVVPVKRVRRIAEALREIKDLKIHWTHFGDGELFDELKEYGGKKLPENITAVFPGRVANTDIYRYYQENNVSLFINVSASEGLPVSIMEACSFGIPIIATDVGGTSEIVQAGVNGILLKEQFTIEDLKQAIQRFAGMERQEYDGYCRASHARFEKDFSAEKNYSAFCQKLIALAEGKNIES